MTGGDYFTGFRDEGSELRKILYFLENSGIVVIRSERLAKSPNPEFDEISIKNAREISKDIQNKNLKKKMEEWRPNWSQRQWILTLKGKKIVEQEEYLKKLLKEGDALRFFTALKNKIEEKEFFIP